MFAAFEAGVYLLEPTVSVCPPSFINTMKPYSTQKIKENCIHVHVKPCKEQFVVRCSISEKEIKVETSPVQLPLSPETSEYMGQYNDMQNSDGFFYGRWSKEEKKRFEQGYKELGHQWATISRDFVKTRSTTQVTSYGCSMLRKRGGLPLF